MSSISILILVSIGIFILFVLIETAVKMAIRESLQEFRKELINDLRELKNCKNNKDLDDIFVNK